MNEQEIKVEYQTESPELPPEVLAMREPVVYLVARQGRNKPCPCGSGVKFKKCHRGKVVRV
jgi:uncharacterized protein